MAIDLSGLKSSGFDDEDDSESKNKTGNTFNKHLTAAKEARMVPASESTTEKIVRSAKNLFSDKDAPLDSIAAVNDYAGDLRAEQEGAAWDKQVKDRQASLYGEEGPSSWGAAKTSLGIRANNLVQGAKEIGLEQLAGAGPTTLEEARRYSTPKILGQDAGAASTVINPFNNAMSIPGYAMYAKNKFLDQFPEMKNRNVDRLVDFKNNKADELYADSLGDPIHNESWRVKAASVAGIAAPELAQMFLTKRPSQALANWAKVPASSVLRKDLFKGAFGTGDIAKYARKAEFSEKFFPNVGADIFAAGLEGGLDQSQESNDAMLQAAITSPLTRGVGKFGIRKPYEESSVVRDKIDAMRHIEEATGKKFFTTTGQVTDDLQQKRFEALVAGGGPGEEFMRNKDQHNAGIIADYIKKKTMPDGPAQLKSDEFAAFDNPWLLELERRGKEGMDYTPKQTVGLSILPDDLKGAVGADALNIPSVKKALSDYEDIFRINNKNSAGPSLLSDISPSQYKDRITPIDEALHRKKKGDIDAASNAEKEALDIIKSEYEVAAGQADPDFLPITKEGAYKIAQKENAIPMIMNPRDHRFDIKKRPPEGFFMTRPLFDKDGMPIPSPKTGGQKDLGEMVFDASDVYGIQNREKLGMGDRAAQGGGWIDNMLTNVLMRPKAFGTNLAAGIGDTLSKDLGNNYLDFVLRDRPNIGGSPTQVASQGFYARQGFNALIDVSKKKAADQAYDEAQQFKERQKKTPFIYPM